MRAWMHRYVDMYIKIDDGYIDKQVDIQRDRQIDIIQIDKIQIDRQIDNFMDRFVDKQIGT